MKMLKRILAAVAASAVSLCIFTACGSDPKYDTSIFINTVRARTGYNVKESKALDDALQAGMDALDPNVDYSTTNEDPDYKGHEQTAYDAIKAKLGDPGATKYQYVKSGSLGGNLRYFARNGESPVAAYAIYNAPLRDFDKEYKELNSAQLYEPLAHTSITRSISSFPTPIIRPSTVRPPLTSRKRFPSASRPSRRWQDLSLHLCPAEGHHVH